MRDLPNLITEVGEYRKTLEDLKLKQFVGTTSVKITETTTDNVWDIDTTMSNGHSVKFYFLADHQVAPFAAFRPTTLIDGVDWTLTNNNKFYENYVPNQSALGITSDDTLERLAVAHYICSVVGSFNLKMKMRVLANDTGTIGWVIL